MVKDARTGWYLVFTKPKQEAAAESHLQRQGFQIYFPLLKQYKHRGNLYQQVIEPLFPRYLFIHLNSDSDDWSKVRSTRGCVSLIRFGLLPARVPDALVPQLKKTEDLRLLPAKSAAPDFKPGDRVQVIDGLLADYEGIVEIKNSQQRVTLLLRIAEGHTRSVNLSVHQVRAV
ncbi:MAG: transcriptional activator RfaH [uncultured bacterium]|nr:MAG: transcriptional activator RfaH [uncultured bacterium]